MNNNRSQGEIFGIMIFFVLIIVGFLLYSQFKIIYSVEEQDIILESEYKLLADSVTQQIKNSQIKCFRDSQIDVIELLDYCVENTGLSFDEYTLNCPPPISASINTCQAFRNVINDSLYAFFNGTSSIPPIHSSKPFTFTVIPSNDIKYSHLNVTFSNLKDFNLSTNPTDSNYYLREGYSRISNDLENIPTNQGSFELEFSFYHKR